MSAHPPEKPQFYTTPNYNHGHDEPKPHLHAKTFLAVFATWAITFHQDAAVPFRLLGVTPQIARAGAEAPLGTFSTGFRHVWIAASVVVAFAAVLAVFLKDPSDEFNMRIDAPVEKAEELYSS
ncbi:hypothetical protein B0T26DRAFT_748986 [Lasiosphaeria miniovina]|uniref:Uncharacterized protein n=1 Tax=Lasiosphaeria miniovina TaxID=1954250 RepID=A0AA40E9B1_9PEZI|nr:uncharacterized protein B0T26DRAFT_748986 [Lasiosphaeria miniovina]KAK0728826.1 hypothetical protein B0T26DRAFT_748986 [Lasiosphaeria miniovina]